MNICIGIISYFPDDKKIREVRKERLEALIKQCDYLYGLPIIIVAQNWQPNEVEVSPSCNVFNFHKLGITGARKQLRQLFLLSRHDYIIMMDDDLELYNSRNNSLQYLDLICKRPTCAFEYKNFLVNMMGLPRWMFSQINFDDVDPEKGEGFEDWIFTEKLKKKYGNNVINIRTIQLVAKERKELVSDPNSTWITPKTDKKIIDENSRRIISAIKAG